VVAVRKPVARGGVDLDGAAPGHRPNLQVGVQEVRAAVGVDAARVVDRDGRAVGRLERFPVEALVAPDACTSASGTAGAERGSWRVTATVASSTAYT